MATRYIQKKELFINLLPPCLLVFPIESSGDLGTSRLQPGRSGNFMTVYLRAGAFAFACEQTV